MNTTEVFLIAMLIIFALPYLVWRLGRTDQWAPLVVVQIVGGIVLGRACWARPFRITAVSSSTRRSWPRSTAAARLVLPRLPERDRWFAAAALLVMAVASTMLTVPVVTPLLRKLGAGLRAEPAQPGVADGSQRT